MVEPRKNQFWKWVKRVSLFILLFLVLVISLLQLSVVQTWLTSKITDYLSGITNTTITAERVSFSPFKGIILNELNIIDEKNETIFIGGAINISLAKNIFYLFNNELDLSYMGFKDISLNIITEIGESKSNVQNFIDNLTSTDKKSSSKSKLIYEIKDIDLSNISVKLNNKNSGKSQIYSITSGNIDVNYLDWVCMEFDINEVLLHQPMFVEQTYNYECSITDELSIEQKPKLNSINAVESIPIIITIRNLAIKDGYFGMSNTLLMPEEKYKGTLDYNNFYFKNIDTYIKDIRLASDYDISFFVESLKAKDDTDFEIHNISLDSVKISPTSIDILSFKIEMGNSIIKDNLSLSFADFNAFSDIAKEVIFNASFVDSKIYLADLEHFVRFIGNLGFVRNNRSEYIELNGRYYGKIDNLAGRDVDIKMGDKLSFAGSFNTRNLLDSDNTVLNIRLDRFKSSMRKMKMIIPSFNVPPNFYKLGSINFEGRFDGYLEDFVAYGKMATDLGSAELDMRLDLTKGTNKANYSGNLNLRNFNLGKWSDNDDFGLVNFKSKVVNGKGLTLNTVRTDVAATVNSLIYKKYVYKDFKVDGLIDKNTFNGGFKISDPNIDFIFNGSFEYLNDMAFLNFKSDVKNIDLKALNISETPLSFKGKMDISTVGNNINDFTGKINVSDLLFQVKDSIYKLNDVKITSNGTVSGNKKLTINSDLGSIDFEGQYDLTNIVNSIKKVIHSNYPYITKPWKESLNEIVNNQRFDFNINLVKSNNFLSLLGVNKSSFNQLALKGRLDTYKNEISIASTIPFFRLDKDSLKNIQLLVTSNKKSGLVLLHVDSTYALGRQFNPIDIQTTLKGDTINFGFSTVKLFDSFESIDLKGQLTPHEKGFNLILDDNLIEMLGTRWQVNPNNKIVLGEKYFSFESTTITDGNRVIDVNDINYNHGISLNVSNFNLELVNDLLNYDKMKFAGVTQLSARILDVYADDKEITSFINIPKFTINDDPYGSVMIDLTKAAKSPYKANISIGDFIAINGTFDNVNKTLDTKVKLRKAPMSILQYLLKDGISNTEGYIDADVVFGGPLEKLDLKGLGMVHKAKTKVNYTGVTYFFDQQPVRISNKEINLDGAILKDINGNSGVVRGGLVHDMFKDFGVNATISGNNVVGLSTSKGDNPSYYGYGVGNLTAEFKGSFDQIDMKINAVTGPGTKLFIPVGSGQASLNQSFINFIKKGEVNSDYSNSNFALNGINVEMSLTLTPDAEVSIIFNEAKGDIIRGTGRGSMKVDITRQGIFEIFGDYEIEQGEYLFTVALLPVAKPFVVARGSTIRWTGDPVNTSLDITANYRTRTTVKPFIEEYLVSATPETQRLAEQRSEVDLQLKVGGTLYKPEINFDLSFPNLTSDIASFADSKLRLLRSNRLELNSQVLGLIVFKSFLPSNRVSDVFGAAGLQSAGINTLSEFLSSQLSLYITNLINSALEEDGFISGIDFEVGMRNNNLAVGNTASSNIFPDEIEVRLKNKFRFMDERFSLNLGGNYVLQNQGLSVNQVLPDFALELVLTDDRKLKIRLYGQSDLDPINNTSLRQKYGLGVAYRTEFGSMVDFEKKLKSGVGKLIEK